MLKKSVNSLLLLGLLFGLVGCSGYSGSTSGVKPEISAGGLPGGNTDILIGVSGVTVKDPEIHKGVASPDVRIRWTIVEASDSIASYWGSGSIVKVGKANYLFTACHVVADKRGTLSIFADGGKLIEATFGPKLTYPRGDVAVFEILTIGAEVVPYTVSTLDVRKTFLSKGYPEGREDLVSESGEGQRVAVETNCKVLPGMSGGGLIQDGKFVGVNTDSAKNPETDQYIGGRHAIASDIIRRLGLE